MGTTAQKLQRVLDTKEGLKDTINTYLGQDITSAIPFKDYETYIKNFYNNAPKTDYAEGSNITLSNTLKGKLDFEDEDGKKVAGKGDSKQITTEGYNELNIYAVHSAGYTETVSGVTFKYNDDGSVTANGKATADINFFLCSRATLGDLFNGTYYLSGCTTGSNSTYYLSMWADGIGVYPQTTTEVATNKTSGVNWNIVIAVKNGATINATFYPMMCATSGKTYEQYSGGYASPSPNWEQDIEVVRGTQTVYIKDENNNIIDTKTINLGEYEFAKIGNYVDTIEYDVDEDKVYKKAYIGKITLNGSENIAKGEDTGYIRFEARGVIPLMIQNTSRTECLSNYFHFLQNGRGVGVCFTYWIYDGSIYIYPQQTITEVDDMKTWLSSNQPIFYYILATPILTELTDTTLKQQVKALYNAHSFTGTTIIEIDGQLPLIIKVRALKGE